MNPSFLKETKHGYPCDMTAEEWDNQLDRMIYCFTEMQEDKCSQKNEYEEQYFQKMSDYKLRELWLQRNAEIYKYRTKMQTEGFELFNKYFRNLWD